MNVFIPDIDRAKLYVQYFSLNLQLAQCVASLKH